MPRARKIKYGFFLNEQLSELPFHTRMLFEGLWLLADREGKLEDRPKKIHALLFPYDHNLNIDANLDALQNAQFLRRYKIDDAQYIKILNFLSHQNPHRDEAQSKIPEPVAQKHGACTIKAPEKHPPNIPCTLYPLPCTLNKEKEIKKKKKKELSSKFEQFYKSYPRKKDRDRAEASFKKINPNDELFSEIMQAVEKQDQEYKLKHTEEGYQFFKYAAPWLNGRCWTDDVDLSAIEKEKRKKSPYTTCKKCGKEILKTLALGGYCEKCSDELYPPNTWIKDKVKVIHA